MDLLHGQGPGGDFVRPAVGGRTGGGRDPVQVHDRLCGCPKGPVLPEFFHDFGNGKASAEARRQLDKEPGSRLMKLRHPGRQVLKHLFILIEPLAVHGIPDRLAARQDQARIVLCRFQDEAGAVLLLLSM